MRILRLFKTVRIYVPQMHRVFDGNVWKFRVELRINVRLEYYVVYDVYGHTAHEQRQ